MGLTRFVRSSLHYCTFIVPSIDKWDGDALVNHCKHWCNSRAQSTRNCSALLCLGACSEGVEGFEDATVHSSDALFLSKVMQDGGCRILLSLSLDRGDG